MDGRDIQSLTTVENDHQALDVALGALNESLVARAVELEFDRLEAIARLIQHEVRTHFPVEEALTASVLGDDSPQFTALLQAHARLTADAEVFLELVERVQCGVLVDREVLIKAAWTLLEGMRHHLEGEEAHLMPLIRARLEVR